MNKNNEDNKVLINQIASQTGVFQSINYANASDEVVNGMADLLLKASSDLPDDKKQGFLFEIIEATKFNVDAAKKRAIERASVLDNNDKIIDIQIKRGNKIIKDIQAKSSKGVEYPKNEFTKRTDYKDVDLLVNKENEIPLKKHFAKKEQATVGDSQKHHKNVKEKITGELKHGDVNSGGTTYAEAMEAAENPKLYALKNELKQFSQEAYKTGTNAAIAGAITGGAVSTMKNFYSVYKGDKSMTDAGADILKDTGKSAVKSGATGVLGTGIRVAGKKIGSNILAKSNIATTCAASLIDIGISVYDYAKGDISGDKLIENIGATGVNTVSGVYYGMVGGIVLGPVGAVVGSIAGYFLSNYIYQSGITLLKSAKLAEEETKKIVALCDASINEMNKQRFEFENKIKEHLELRELQFDKLFDNIDKGLLKNDNVTTINALSDLSLMFGKELKLINFDDFDKFMRTDDKLEI